MVRTWNRRGYIALGAIVALAGIALAVTIQSLGPFREEPLTPSAPGNPGLHNWRTLEGSIVDQRVRFNVERFLATETGTHIFYSIFAPEELKDSGLVPDNIEVRDDTGRQFPVTRVTPLGNYAGVSVGVVSIGPYEGSPDGRSHTLTISIPALKAGSAPDADVAVTGKWTLSFVERLDPGRQLGTDGLAWQEEEPATAGISVEFDDFKGVVVGGQLSTHRVAIKDSRSGNTWYVYMKVTPDNGVVPISAQEYDQIYLDAIQKANEARTRSGLPPINP